MPPSAQWQPAGYSYFGQKTAHDYWAGTQPCFDGAWGMPSSAHWQPAGYSYFGQKTTAHDYWGGTQPWHENSSYDFRDSREKQRQEEDRGWDYNNWHESQPSEPGSFSWTENEELWKQAEDERIKAEEEREEKADVERRRRREERRAERHKEQKRRNIARAPEKQKKLSGEIIALDEEISRLKAVSRRPTPAGEAEEGCRPDEEGSDAVDHFSIKLNRRVRVLSEAISIHHNLCRVQRANGQADEAENAEQELAKAREASALRLAHELARDDEGHRAGRASLHEEHLRMQPQRHQSNQEEERKLQERYNRNNATSENQRPNGRKATVERSNTEGTWSGGRNVYGLRFKLQEQADLGGKIYGKQLHYQGIHDWLDQLDNNEENEAPSPPQASHNVFIGEPEPLISHLDQNALFPPSFPTLADSKPEPLISGLTAEPSEPDTEAVMPNYIQMVHNPHLEVHSEFWDFVVGDEVNCDFCGVVLSVLQCPNCNARACSECKTHRGQKGYNDMKGWR